MQSSKKNSKGRSRVTPGIRRGFPNDCRPKVEGRMCGYLRSTDEQPRKKMRLSELGVYGLHFKVQAPLNTRQQPNGDEVDLWRGYEGAR